MKIHPNNKNLELLPNRFLLVMFELRALDQDKRPQVLQAAATYPRTKSIREEKAAIELNNGFTSAAQSGMQSPASSYTSRRWAKLYKKLSSMSWSRLNMTI